MTISTLDDPIARLPRRRHAADHNMLGHLHPNTSPDLARKMRNALVLLLVAMMCVATHAFTTKVDQVAVVVFAVEVDGCLAAKGSLVRVVGYPSGMGQDSKDHALVYVSDGPCKGRRGVIALDSLRLI